MLMCVASRQRPSHTQRPHWGAENATHKVWSEAYDKEQHRRRHQRQRRSTYRHNAVPFRLTSDDGVADMNRKLLEGVAASTKEWGVFLNCRLAANFGAAAAGCSLRNGRRNAERLF